MALAFMLYVPNMAESVSRGLAAAIYGVIMLLVVFVMPSGRLRRKPAAYLLRRRLQTEGVE
jgi:branched-chain amino acid transport system permease protein